MTYPNSSPDHQSEQTPDCWEELTAEERETWQSLTHDERRAFPLSCALDVIRRALDVHEKRLRHRARPSERAPTSS